MKQYFWIGLWIMALTYSVNASNNASKTASISQQLLKQAQAGNVNAQYQLGSMYYFGTGIGQDYALAKTWLEKSADNASAPAQLLLGQLYEDGSGVKPDYAIAADCYLKALHAGNRDAMDRLMNVVRIFYYGHGVPINYPKAAELVQPLADKGFSEAEYMLGIMYYFGRGLDQDYPKAAETYTRAAKKGLAQAQYMLGTLYEGGLGVDPDPAEAMQWYKLAANQKYPEAQIALAALLAAGKVSEPDPARAMALYYQAGMKLFNNQDHEKARACLDKMRALDANHPSVARLAEKLNVPATAPENQSSTDDSSNSFSDYSK